MVDTREAFKFESVGTLTTGTGKDEWEATFAGTILGAEAVVKTAPTGATLILDILKNGTTIYTGGTNRPTIAIGALTTGPTVVSLSNDTSTDSWTVQNPGTGYVQPKPSKGSETYSTSPDLALAGFVDGDVFSLSITQVGSTVAGADLDVTVQYSPK